MTKKVNYNQIVSERNTYFSSLLSQKAHWTVEEILSTSKDLLIPFKGLKEDNIESSTEVSMLYDIVYLQLELTTNDKLAAIAHEIGHIIYFFLENKPIDEELKADEFACKIGLSRELLGLLGKMKKANIYDETTSKYLERRLMAIKEYMQIQNTESN